MFDAHSILDLEKLCRIKCTHEEEKDLLSSLKRVLEYVEQLNEIDTTDVAACNYVLKDMINTKLRDDVPEEPMSREAFFANAPDKTGELIRVPPIIKDL